MQQAALNVVAVEGVPVFPFRPSKLPLDYVELAEAIHIDNAKWWQDLDTGACILPTRNRGDLLMLVVTEICEAAAGIDGRAEDKLPHLPMYDCELADTAIRTLDLIGAELKLGRLDAEMARKLFDIADFDMLTARAMSMPNQLFAIVRAAAAAKEAERKSRWGEFHVHLVDIAVSIFGLADLHRIDLFDVIEQKRAFNRVRADHKVENRRAADGKRS